MAIRASRTHISFVNRPSANARASNSDAEHFLASARKSFQLASESASANDIERHAKMGREFLQLAHRAAELKDSSPTLWSERS